MWIRWQPETGIHLAITKSIFDICRGEVIRHKQSKNLALCPTVGTFQQKAIDSTGQIR
jgi:hypothetical protein